MSAQGVPETLHHRCPRCRRIDYLPLPELGARCLRCGLTYRRRWVSEAASPSAAPQPVRRFGAPELTGAEKDPPTGQAQ